MITAKFTEVNACDITGYSLLAIASESRHENTVQLLVENCANANLFGKKGPLSLHVSCCKELDNIAKFLI